jgi:hypothetical protein
LRGLDASNRPEPIANRNDQGGGDCRLERTTRKSAARIVDRALERQFDGVQAAPFE